VGSSEEEGVGSIQCCLPDRGRKSLIKEEEWGLLREGRAVKGTRMERIVS
jgi:hypothetical protein